MRPHQQLTDGDKAAVRDQLPPMLAAPESKLRTAAGAAIAAIYNFDGDSSWPGLVEMLVGAVQRRDSPHLGARRARAFSGVRLGRAGACAQPSAARGRQSPGARLVASTARPHRRRTPLPAAAVAGALRCLCLMAQDLDEERKPALLGDLSGALHAIVSAEAGGLAAGGGGGGLVRMALRIMVELVAGALLGLQG